jgi:hypothetical protein
VFVCMMGQATTTASPLSDPPPQDTNPVMNAHDSNIGAADDGIHHPTDDGDNDNESTGNATVEASTDARVVYDNLGPNAP